MVDLDSGIAVEFEEASMVLSVLVPFTESAFELEVLVVEFDSKIAVEFDSASLMLSVPLAEFWFELEVVEFESGIAVEFDDASSVSFMFELEVVDSGIARTVKFPNSTATKMRQNLRNFIFNDYRTKISDVSNVKKCGLQKLVVGIYLLLSE